MACSDDITGPTEAEFELLCDQTEPVRILALDPDERPESVDVSPFGDRYLVQLNEWRDANDSPVGGKGRVSRQLWSVGQCGADPLLLATDIDYYLQQFDPYPDVVFGCRDADRSLVALDPTGAREPKLVFATHDCTAFPTTAGLVTILDDDADGEVGTLVLQPWPDDPFAQAAEQVVLLDGVKLEAGPQPYLWSSMDDVFDATADEVFAVSTADELVAVSLDDFTTTVLATGVREFERSADGRWFLMQDVEVTSDEFSGPSGALMLLDREVGTVTELGDGILEYTNDPFLLAPFDLLTYQDAAAISHYISLSNLEPPNLPGELAPIRVIDDNRVLLGYASAPPYVVANVNTGDLTVLFDGTGRARFFSDAGLVVFDHQSQPGGMTLTGSLTYTSYSGESTPIAEDVIAPYEVATDHRVISPFAVGSDDIGQLVVVDPETLDQRHIADDVLSTSPTIYEPTPGELVVNYLVVDTDPSRHGVWTAKPAK